MQGGGSFPLSNLSLIDLISTSTVSITTLIYYMAEIYCHEWKVAVLMMMVMT